MPKRLAYKLLTVCALALVFAFVFPRIAYTPGAGVSDAASVLFIVLGIGVVILRVVRLRQR